MGKHGGSLTAAAISKRMKAKGLGRLRWYCQMCEKQCRDENGFKNHTQSAGHQRQLALFSENPNEYINRFSDSFRTEFLLVLRRRYGTNMVAANMVYQEYIKDRDHLHMNATKWTTLSEFVKDLGKEGFCKVQDRDDGWWLSFIDRAAAEKEQRAREMDRRRLAQERRADNLLRERLRAAINSKHTNPTHADKQKQNESLPDVNIGQLGTIKLEQTVQIRQPQLHHWDRDYNPLDTHSSIAVSEDNPSEGGDKSKKRKRRRWEDAPKLSALEEIMLAERAVKPTVSSKREAEQHSVNEIIKPEQPAVEEDGPWITKGIVVKITNKNVGNGAFHGKKGSIIDTIDGYGARVQIFDIAAVLELDQDDLETVIPKPGGEVVLLRAPYRGQTARVLSINIDSFTVDVSLTESAGKITDLDYEAVSRLA